MRHLVKRPLPAELTGYRARCAAVRFPGRCWHPAVLSTHTEYVTGNAGRVTWRVSYVCEQHGRQFAEKHGCTVPADPEPLV